MRSLIEESITSSQLEGASTTREIAKEMIREGRQPRDRGERMIFNNYQTMMSILEFKNQAMTRDLLFGIHRLVTDGTLGNPRGGRTISTGQARTSWSVMNAARSSLLPRPPRNWNDAWTRCASSPTAPHTRGVHSPDGEVDHPSFLAGLRPSLRRWKWQDGAGLVLLVHAETWLLVVRIYQYIKSGLSG